MDDAISRVAEELSTADDNLDFTALQAPLAPLATVKSNVHIGFCFLYLFIISVEMFLICMIGLILVVAWHQNFSDQLTLNLNCISGSTLC